MEYALLFRCTQPGMLADILQSAGFQDIEEKPVSGILSYNTTEEYWQNMMEVAAPVVASMRQADETTRTAVKTALFAALEQKLGA
uniref:Uncharacterized protein n=1 Tax=Tanacetum cinerariifolium TaxID=118510 RepID=A0A699V384_TANCI|nr:hypothetical protein [Tanacetum cinerariifolium]